MVITERNPKQFIINDDVSMDGRVIGDLKNWIFRSSGLFTDSCARVTSNRRSILAVRRYCGYIRSLG